MTSRSPLQVSDEVRARLLSSPAAQHWQRIGVRHHHGINLPLSALHSDHSGGIGEFLDLLPIIDWCGECGLDVIQLLPLNSSGRDPSPYNALSAFALHPIYLSLDQLPQFSDDSELAAGLRELRALSKRKRVAYGRVLERKRELLWRYWKTHGQHHQHNANYQAFFHANSWLEGYALFHSLRNRFPTVGHRRWPEEYRSPDAPALAKLYSTFREEIDYHCFVQYHCFEQMRRVKAHAEGRGVFLKGDIPILISPDSADVWHHRELFNTQLSVGVPPDAYSADGQCWGFPIYCWEAMEKDDYRWWRERLTTASQFYHIYRLDHVVGFFRLWSIAHGKKATEGQFYPEEPERWVPQGENTLLMMLSHSPMLPIGEDLGVVPDEVRQSLQRLGICGTKVLRWERCWHEPNQPYIAPGDYLPESMTTASTHDSETLQQWWQRHDADRHAIALQKGWQCGPALTSEQHKELLRDSHCSSSLFHINLLQEYLALVPGMTANNIDDERINMPGIRSAKNWRYRFRPSVKEITESEQLRHVFQEIIPNNTTPSTATL